jgi:hypothetical protein
MAGTIDFHHDQKHDIVIATPHWRISTEADVHAWFAQYAGYMKTFARKMDTIVVLDDFEVDPIIGAKWGEYRAKLHKQFLRHNFRVHTARNVKLFVNTSGVRFNISTSEAASVEGAIEGILELRETAKAG